MARILYVNVLGGPPFQDVIPKLQTLGEVLVIQPTPISKADRRQLLSLTSQVMFPEDLPKQMDLKKFLTTYAQATKTNALITFDELYLREVSFANNTLGLPGAGPHIERSLRKDYMYQHLQRHGLLERKYFASRDIAKLKAFQLPLPFVIKPVTGSGALGVILIDRPEAELALETHLETSRRAIHNLITDARVQEYLDCQPFIKEEALLGNAKDWFGENTCYADALSVEGMVVGGRYHPIAIAQHYPLAPPFTETVSVTPCTLPLETQLRITEEITPCIESLGLQNCGVHTELKLLSEGRVAIIETSARLASGNIISQIEQVFGIDVVTEHVRSLLDDRYRWPYRFDRIFRGRQGAAATVNLLPVYESGKPWENETELSNLDLSPATAGLCDCVVRPTVDIGNVLKPYSAVQGVWNRFGQVILTAPNMRSLDRGIQNIRRNLRQLVQLPQGGFSGMSGRWESSGSRAI